MSDLLSLTMCDDGTDRACQTSRIRRVRPSLRIIISSATINAEEFVDFFNVQPPSSSSASSGIQPADDVPPPAKKSRWDKTERLAKDAAIMVRLEGRAFPVEISYLNEPTSNVVTSAVSVIFDIHLKVRFQLAALQFGF